VKYTQKEKQRRGQKGEALITASLQKAGIWNHKLVNAGYGTVFDKLVIPPGGGYAFEVKVRQVPRIGYNTKSITPNERRGLDRFMQQVGTDKAYIIGIWQTEKEGWRAFLIPWAMVRDDVLSGCRGSIKMQEYQELKKIPGGWDMSFLKGDETE
jgi:hypothetical protein